MGRYRDLMFPLLAPSFAVVMIWQSGQAWNVFLFAAVLAGQSRWPVTMAFNYLAAGQLVRCNVLMAVTP